MDLNPESEIEDVYFFVVTNTMGNREKDVYKYAHIGCNGKAYIMKYYISKPEISYGALENNTPG